MACTRFLVSIILLCVVALSWAQDGNCPYGGFENKHLAWRLKDETRVDAALRRTMSRP